MSEPLQGTGKVALVTGSGGGADGGIGAGIARVLASNGYHVVVNDVRADVADKTVAQIEEVGGSASADVFDVTDSAQVHDHLGQLVATHGRLDVLVNNAGIVGTHSVLNTTDDEWDSVLGVNLTGPFKVSRAALPYLFEAGNGRIINISSIAGIRIAGLGGAVYTASKAGLLGLTRHLAAEVGVKGVTVNAICPGLTLTPLIARRTTEESLGLIKASVPTQSAGTPDDIGEVVVFLASPKAHYIHGEAIVHDGGKTLLQGDYVGWVKTAGLE
jgi:3-oxoacyl-[acyl-carrier protein] reductase